MLLSFENKKTYIYIYLFNNIYIVSAPNKCTNTVEYVYIFFTKSPPHVSAHTVPSSEMILLSLVQNYLLIVMLLHWVQSIR
jgi:hypothetical protein